MNNQHRHYQSYLIRFQRAEGRSQWRVTLQDVQSGEVLHFATEREALRAMLNQLQEPPPEDESIGSRPQCQAGFFDTSE